MYLNKIFMIFIIIINSNFTIILGKTPYYIPSYCEVCKSLVALIEQRLHETDQPHHMLKLGYYTDNLVPPRQQHYITSELRLVEILEDACSKIYDIKSTAEAYNARTKEIEKKKEFNLSKKDFTLRCEALIEKHEKDIEAWYFNYQEIPMIKYLCEERALQRSNRECLEYKDEVSFYTKNKNDSNEKLQNLNVVEIRSGKYVKDVTNDVKYPGVA